MFWLRVIVVALAALAAVSPASAVNLAFMPGDAFFHSELTAESLKRFTDAGAELGYVYPPDSGALCGYAGFHRLKITGDTAALARGVAQVYAHLRTKYPLEVRIDTEGHQTEINGFSLLVYERSVFRSCHAYLGLKYNESWAALPAEAFESAGRKLGFGHTRAERYTAFVRGAKAVVRDWKSGPSIPGLPVLFPPNLGWGVSGKRIDTPTEVDASAIQIVILNGDFDGVFTWMSGDYRIDEDGYVDFYHEFYSVREDGIERWFSTDQGGIKSEPWTPSE